MKRLWMSGAAAVMAMSIASVGAQTPQNPPPQNPPATPPTQAQPPQTQRPATRPATPMTQGASTTLQGCVYQEKDVPGRTPNVAEKAGVLEDYIFVPSAEAGATAGTTGMTPPATGTTPPATGTAGAAPKAMGHKAFKLEKVDDDKLKMMVGKRVEVTGRIDAEHSDMKAHGDAKAHGTAGAPAADKSMGPDKIELPEFEVTSIREVSGTCPATPQIKK